MKKITKLTAMVLAAIMLVSMSAAAFSIQKVSENVKVVFREELVDAKAIIVNDRALLPVTLFNVNTDEPCKYFGDFCCYSDGKNFSVEGGDSALSFDENSMEVVQYWSDGTKKSTPVDVPAIRYNGVLYLPVRAMFENWGKTVSWNDGSRTVTIH